MAYRQSLQDGLPVAQAEQRLAEAKAKLDGAAKLLGGDGLSWSLSFVSGLLILLREGLEAIPVLAAILAFLRNTGQQSAVRSVNLGWGLALVAGFATWALAAYVIDVGGAQRELLEGCTALFAAVMVLWLGVWMHDRRHAAAWQDYIKSSLVSGGGRFGFAVLAFFSVYRELFEVILFYETLWLQAGPAGHNAVLAGGATALVLLVGLAWVILRGSAKLPLSLFFTINAALLCVLSVVFAGHGIKALQEAGVLGTRPVAFFEFDWLGIHADAYSLGAQALALLAIMFLYGRSRLAESAGSRRAESRSRRHTVNLWERPWAAIGGSSPPQRFRGNTCNACMDRCRRLSQGGQGPDRQVRPQAQVRGGAGGRPGPDQAGVCLCSADRGAQRHGRGR